MRAHSDETPLALDLSCEIAGVRLSNPLVLASGILGTSAALMVRMARLGAGAITAKSATRLPRTGHPSPILFDWGHGLINAVGLTNPGAEGMAAILSEARKELAPMGVPLIASVFAARVEEFVEVARILAAAGPDMIELNLSCPNVAAEYGEMFAASPRATAEAVAAVKAAVSCPVIAKLSPNVPDIARIARAAEEAGADAITAVNTMPGMVIDIEAGRPILTNREGGLSGPALKPIAIRCVYEIARAVRIPIIGTGGVLTGEDAIEMLMAGATAVGVGSAVAYRGLGAFRAIRQEMEAWMRAHGVRCLAEIRGRAHRVW
ncbi:dihydroorotate dehydrogenase [Thermoflexus hugenholtzii]